MSVIRFRTHSPQRRSRRTLRDPPPITLPIPGYAGLLYDTRNLSPVSAGRAAEGIKADFEFDSLQNMSDGRDRYIAFQLHVPIAVRVYDPIAQRVPQNRATCNCEDYQSTQSACAHLYWLFTRLNAALREDDRQENQREEMRTQDSTTQVEVFSDLSALYPLIERRGDSLPRDLKDELDDEELETDSDGSAVEDSLHNEPADAYEPSSSSAQVPRRRGSNHGF